MATSPPTRHLLRRSGAMKRLNMVLSASPACALKNLNWPASCASVSMASILPRNRRASRLTCTRKLEPGGDPSRSVEREPSAGHDHMHMRMMGKRRSPGVQHGGNADPGAEAPGIGGDGERCLGRRLHQQVVDHALVLVSDVAQLGRQREHDVKIWDGQQLRFAVGQPSARSRSLALRTMPVAAENYRRSEGGRSRSSQPSTCPPRAAVRQFSIADMTFNWRRLRWPALALRHAAPWVAEDIRDFQICPPHALRGLWRGRLKGRFSNLGLQRGQAIQRAHDRRGWVLAAMRV